MPDSQPVQVVLVLANVTQNAPAPKNSVQNSWLKQPQRPALTPHRVGPSPSGWKHLPPLPHVPRSLTQESAWLQISLDPQGGKQAKKSSATCLQYQCGGHGAQLRPVVCPPVEKQAPS